MRNMEPTICLFGATLLVVWGNFEIFTMCHIRKISPNIIAIGNTIKTKEYDWFSDILLLKEV